MPTFDVVALGQACIDYLGVVDPYPAVDQKAELSALAVQGGGPAATAMVAAARLGLRTGLVAKVGDDAFGSEILRGLHAEGVDTVGVVVAPGKTSQFAFVAVERASATRTVFWTRGSAHPLELSEVRIDLVRAARMLHLDGLHAAASLEAARVARAAGIPVMMDAGTLRDDVRPLLPLVDYLVVTEGFARSWLGCDDAEAVLWSLAELGPRLVCVTMGARGCVALDNGNVSRQCAWAVDAVDTTGCGDAFHGGLIYALLQAWPTPRALAFASAVAALKCRGLGGRSALPTLAEVHAFLEPADT